MSKYRADIDGLRAVAVLSVVGFHAFPSLIKGGFVGVDIFFVISGYLISDIIFRELDKGSFSFASFYSRRIKRIFPALLLVLSACYAFGWFALFADEYKQLGKHIASGAGFLSNFVLWNESGYFDNAAETKPLLHLWSLGIEEQFYLAWPLLLYLGWKRKFNLFFLMVTVLGLSFLLNVKMAHVDVIGDFYSPWTRFWELLFGSVLAHVLFYRTSFLEKSSDAVKNAISVAGLLVLALAVLVLTKEKLFPGWWALLPTIGACLLIAASPQAWGNRKVLAHPVLVWFGLISYPLYLWHWPLLALCRIIESTTPSVSVRLAAIAASVVLAWLTYQLVEKPVRFGKGYGNAKIAVLCSLMLVIGYIGYNTYEREGLAFRSAVRLFYENKNQLARTPAMDDRCKAFVNKTEPQFPYCRYNDIGAKETVALIGDSHAHASFPGLAELVAEKKKNLVLMANSGCPPLVGSVTGDNETDRKACVARIDELIKTIVQKEEIKTVIISTRAPIYISGNGFGEAEKDYRNKPLQAANRSAPEAGKADEVFRVSLQNTIDLLRQSGKSVYYVLENPEIGIDPAGCLSRPFRENKHLNCAIQSSVVKDRQARYRELMKTIRGAKIIDPLTAFCPGEACTVFAEGKLLYADNNHLSVEGSRFQAREVLAPLLAF